MGGCREITGARVAFTRPSLSGSQPSLSRIHRPLKASGGYLGISQPPWLAPVHASKSAVSH